MFNPGNPLNWVCGLALMAAAFVLLQRYFSVEARQRRRREKSRGKVVSQRPGPWVKLAVKTRKRKQDR